MANVIAEAFLMGRCCGILTDSVLSSSGRLLTGLSSLCLACSELHLQEGSFKRRLDKPFLEIWLGGDNMP